MRAPTSAPRLPVFTPLVATLSALAFVACAPGDGERDPDRPRGSALGASEVQLPADPALTVYTPGASHTGWERREPAQVGMDPEAVQEAVDYALAHETAEIPEDPGDYLRERFAGLPDQEIVGPTVPRSGVNGIVVKDGYIVAEFGDTDREDMTFSVTKSYLATVAGLAWADGLIPALDDPMADVLPDSLFPDERTRAITWRHLLHQASEWEGTLFGKPDRADRREGIDRTLREPGSFWEYNDVRVNLMAYALLLRLEEPLPEVLEARVMDPIGASDDWRWHGYETSWTEVAGRRVQSVSGGGHWGGGLFIDTRDHARFGLLALRHGRWGGEQLVPSRWFRAALTPGQVKPDYGFMWWLNAGRELLPSAPETAFMAVGAGWTNVIYVDPEHDLVAVTRWVDGPEHVDGFIQRILAAVGPG